MSCFYQLQWISIVAMLSVCHLQTVTNGFITFWLNRSNSLFILANKVKTPAAERFLTRADRMQHSYTYPKIIPLASRSVLIQF